jgi:DNA adenine methylase
VLKWAGGKTPLTRRILELLPAQMNTYFEPFFGGGAVFFALAREKRFRSAVLSDVNPELVNVYRVLKDNVDGLVKQLQRMKISEEDFYLERERKPTSAVRQAARTIYLNKTGFNGLYRVNQSGKFNVPYGRHVNPKICDEPNLRAAAAVLKNVELVVEDFERSCKRAQPGDAVYLDPPYLPLSTTASFTSYDRHPFGIAQHERLAEVFDELSEHEISAVLSNSCTADSKRLYRSHHVEFPLVARSINSNSKKRGKIKEILVCNRAARAARSK